MPPTPTSASGSGRGRGGGGRGSRGGGVRSGSAAARASAAHASGSGGVGSQRGGMGNARRTNVGIGQGRRGPFVYRGEFRRDVQGLMYAFGDSASPDPQAVALLEDMAVSFLVDLIRRARPTPTQVNVATNSAQVTSMANAYFQQQASDREQERLDDALIRAAAGTSTSMNRRTAGADQNSQARHAVDNAVIRTAVHPHIARTRLTVEDIKFACRKDAKLTSRIEELIYLDKEISSARRVFDVPAEEAIQDNTVGANNASQSQT